MVYQNATEARKDFSSMLDKAVFDRPQFIQRTKDHILVIGEGLFEQTLANNNLHIHIKKADDGNYIARPEEIEDLISTGKSREDAIDDMCQSLLDYAKEYYNEFGLYSRAPNRKQHLPYVMRILTLATPERIKEMLVCQDGEN